MQSAYVTSGSERVSLHPLELKKNVNFDEIYWNEKKDKKILNTFMGVD